jgi:hypothetical protein
MNSSLLKRSPYSDVATHEDSAPVLKKAPCSSILISVYTYNFENGIVQSLEVFTYSLQVFFVCHSFNY